MAITKLLADSITSGAIANTPNFFAYRNAALSISHATWTTIVYDAEDFDSDSGFDLTTGIYTVPEAGKYYFEYIDWTIVHSCIQQSCLQRF